MLLVSNPDIKARTIHSFVETTQVAPTILQILGLDPNKLDAVRKEGTPVLPGLSSGTMTDSLRSQSCKAQHQQTYAGVSRGARFFCGESIGIRWNESQPFSHC